MEHISLLYWIKVGLGILTAIICVLLSVDNLLSGIGIGIVIYALSDRVLRQLFIDKVDKPSTVTKTGIGIFILSWVFFWALLYTLVNPPI